MAQQPKCYETILLYRQETLGIPFVPAMQGKTNWSKYGNSGQENKYLQQFLVMVLENGAVMTDTVYRQAERTLCFDSVRPATSWLL